MQLEIVKEKINDVLYKCLEKGIKTYEHVMIIEAFDQIVENFYKRFDMEVMITFNVKRMNTTMMSSYDRIHGEIKIVFDSMEKTHYRIYKEEWPFFNTQPNTTNISLDDYIKLFNLSLDEIYYLFEKVDIMIS